MLRLSAETNEAARAIGAAWGCRPKVGIILGSGLGGFVDQIEVERAIPYGRLPHFTCATADGHNGQLICGRLDGVPVIAMAGRFHAYEGYSLAQITLPVRVMKALGIELLILSNAAGGMNPRYRWGDIMVVEDHIDFLGRKLVAGGSGGRRHAQSERRTEPYCPRLIERALAIARRAGFSAHRGVYAAMTGPNYETRAEYRFLRAIEADAVGMSTAPEAAVAAECGLGVLALSTITNICLPDRLTPARHEEVLEAAASAEPKVRRIIMDIIGDAEPAAVKGIWG